MRDVKRQATLLRSKIGSVFKITFQNYYFLRKTLINIEENLGFITKKKLCFCCCLFRSNEDLYRLRKPDAIKRVKSEMTRFMR